MSDIYYKQAELKVGSTVVIYDGFPHTDKLKETALLQERKTPSLQLGTITGETPSYWMVNHVIYSKRTGIRKGFARARYLYAIKCAPAWITAKIAQ